MRALRETKTKLKENKTQIFVRRGGPNHLEGLRYDLTFLLVSKFAYIVLLFNHQYHSYHNINGCRLMRELGTALGVPIHVYGPETHMTAIVGMAMGKREIVDPSEMMSSEDSGGQNFSLPTMVLYP